MEKCNSYINHPWSDKYGYCMGTKNRDLCTCQGDKSKCDFYPEKRNKKMTTLEMMNLAKETGKTYKIQDMLYNVSRGFHDKSGKPWDGYAFDKLNDLFDIETWREDPTIYMTKAEVEKRYDIKIID